MAVRHDIGVRAFHAAVPRYVGSPRFLASITPDPAVVEFCHARLANDPSQMPSFPALSGQHEHARRPRL